MIGSMHQAAVLVVVSLGTFVATGSTEMLARWLFVAGSFLVMGLLALDMPRGGRMRLQGGAVVAAIGLLDPFVAASSYILASAFELALFPPESRVARHLSVVTLRALGIAGGSLVFGLLQDSVEAPGELVRAGLLLLIGVAYMVFDLSVESGSEVGIGTLAGLRSTTGLLRVVGAGYLAQVSVGAVLVTVYPRLNEMSFVVLVPLMLIMQHTTGLLVRVRGAYMRTVGVLVRVAEMQAGSSEGHAERVSRMSVAIGRQVGLGTAQIERLAMAALLHDIGRLRLQHVASRQALAEVGALVLSRMSFLSSLSPVVGRQAMDYVEYLDRQDVDGRLARIIRLASDADDLLAGCSTSKVIDQRVLARLQEGSGSSYEPDLVEALCSAPGLGGDR